MSINPSANRQIAQAAGTVALAIVIGQLAGLLRGIIVGQAFPVAELDAFLAANRVSETLFLLVAGGALGSAFIPTFTGFLAQEKRESAWKLASAIANLVLLILSLLALVAFFFAPQIVRYGLAPGLSENPALFTLTVELMRIQLLASVLFGLGGLLVGILNAHRVFFIPALAPSMYQLGMIFGVLALAPSMGIHGLAWGVVLGAGMYLLLQIPALLKQKGRYSPTLGLAMPSVREVITLMGPRLLGVGVVQLNFWVNIRLASNMSAGSVTGLSYGFMLMLMAQAAIAQSIAIAAMPTFSAQVALNKLDEMRNSLATALRGLLLLAVPASVGLMILRQPLVSMLYEYGQFTSQTTILVAWALLWYAAGLVGHAVLEVMARAFFALHDTKTPVIVGSIAMFLNILFSFGFAALFETIGWMPHGGLALANSLATALEVAVLLWLMRRRLNGLEGKSIALSFIKTALAASVMGLALFIWLNLAGELNRWTLGLGGVALGGLVYAACVLALRVPETQLIISMLKRLTTKFTERKGAGS